MFARIVGSLRMASIAAALWQSKRARTFTLRAWAHWVTSGSSRPWMAEVVRLHSKYVGCTTPMPR